MRPARRPRPHAEPRGCHALPGAESARTRRAVPGAADGPGPAIVIGRELAA